MRCRKLLETDKLCVDTTDCAMDHVCWPKTPNDALLKKYTCQPVHSNPEFVTIGFRIDSSKNIMQNSFAAGLMCQSGIAKILNSTSAICVKISAVLSNLNNFKSELTGNDSFHCDLNQEYSTP